MEEAMATNPTDTTANRAKDEKGNRNLTSISPFFIVKDLQVSISYYIGPLGFQLDFQGPATTPNYPELTRNGTGSILKPTLPDCLPQQNQTRHEWPPWTPSLNPLDPT